MNLTQILIIVGLTIIIFLLSALIAFYIAIKS